MATRQKKSRAQPREDLNFSAAVADADAKDQEHTLNLIRFGQESEDGIWIPGPLWWAWYCTETFDNHYLDKKLSTPHRPFPRLPYLRWLFHRFLTRKIAFVPKSREMMASWAVVAYCVWMCQLFSSVRVLIQSQKLDKASELVKGTEPPGYGRTLWERQDPWLRTQFPLAVRLEDQPADKLSWKNDSVITAIGKGADQVRLYHPTIYVVDEAAHMEEFEGSFSSAIPVAKQIICISSAGPGFFGDVCAES